MKFINLYITVSIAMLVIGCNEKQVSEPLELQDDSIIQISKEQFSHAQMKLGTLESHQFNTAIALNGHTAVPPHNKATIATYYGGYISYSPFLIGDSVKKGQVIIKMKNPDFIELQENYIKAFEDYHYLKIDFKRQEQLYHKSVIADKDFQEISKEYKSALANVTSIGAQLELLDLDLKELQKGLITSEIEIKAPINGIISRSELNLGVYIPAQSEMMELVNNSDIHLELEVFEKDLGKLHPGQQIEFNTIGSDHSYKAALKLIGSEVEAEHRTILVHADLLDSNTELIPGQYVNAIVYTTSEQLEALPLEAFIAADDQHYVLILEEQNQEYYRFRKQSVTLLTSDDKFQAFDTSEVSGKEFLISGGFQLF